VFLSKRGGVYYLFFVDDNGIRRKVSTRQRTKSEALRLLRTLQTQAAPTLSTPKTVPLSMFQDEYLAYFRTVHRPNVAEVHTHLPLAGTRPGGCYPAGSPALRELKQAIRAQLGRQTVELWPHRAERRVADSSAARSCAGACEVVGWLQAPGGDVRMGRHLGGVIC